MTFVRKQFLIIGAVLLIALGFLMHSLLGASGGTIYTSVSAKSGPITQEVLASGNVESPTVNNLHFKGSGKLVLLSVATGQHINAGMILAKQDSSVLDASLQQAQANVSAAVAGLHTLETGATPQSIAVSRARLGVTELALTNTYASVGTTLTDAQAKANDAVINQLADFFSNAQTTSPKLTFIVNDFTISNRIVAERAEATIKLTALQKEVALISSGNPAPAEYDNALASTDNYLTALQKLARDSVAAVAVSSGLSATNLAPRRASASAALSEINAAREEVEALQHLIAVKKSAVSLSHAGLNLVTAPAAQSTIDAQKAIITAARARAAGISAQIQTLEIVAPEAGIVTNTNGTVGEVIGPNIIVVSLIPDAKLQVKVNVSEDNIVGVTVGDHARIELDAFPVGTDFSGTVSAIDPAQTVIGGAIYYKTTILFDKNYKNVKPGMTANVYITTASSSDAVLIPASALTTTATSSFVRILKKGIPEVRTVTTGLTSQNGMIQITSGLSAGETVVTGNK